jgi:hypothetical protein
VGVKVQEIGAVPPDEGYTPADLPADKGKGSGLLGVIVIAGKLGNAGHFFAYARMYFSLGADLTTHR